MPARVVDGDSLWRSNKLKKVTQVYRAEYANLLPLAEANGVFDADPERVWSDVYAFNRPDVSLEMVEEILDEFEQADLLRRWKERDKLWGFWVGITKTGRLPSENHIKRYKNLPPNPPPNLSGIIRDESGTVREASGIMPEGFGIGIGIGLDRYGKGEEQSEPPLEDIFEYGQGEESMKAEKTIPASCVTLLGVRAETYPDVIEQIKSRARATSNGQVLREFEEWAVENQGDDFRGKPLSAWLRSYTSGRIEQKQATENPVIKAIGREIAYRSKGQMVLEPKHKAGLLVAVEEEDYTFDEVMAAYSEFFQKMDKDNAKNLEFAAGNFVKQAPDLLYAVRRQRQEKDLEASAVAQAATRMQEEAEAERRARREKQAEEELMIEDELPD